MGAQGLMSGPGGQQIAELLMQNQGKQGGMGALASKLPALLYSMAYMQQASQQGQASQQKMQNQQNQQNAGVQFANQLGSINPILGGAAAAGGDPAKLAQQAIGLEEQLQRKTKLKNFLNVMYGKNDPVIQADPQLLDSFVDAVGEDTNPEIAAKAFQTVKDLKEKGMLEDSEAIVQVFLGKVQQDLSDPRYVALGKEAGYTQEGLTAKVAMDRAQALLMSNDPKQHFVGAKLVNDLNRYGLEGMNSSLKSMFAAGTLITDRELASKKKQAELDLTREKIQTQNTVQTKNVAQANKANRPPAPRSSGGRRSSGGGRATTKNPKPVTVSQEATFRSTFANTSTAKDRNKAEALATSMKNHGQDPTKYGYNPKTAKGKNAALLDALSRL